VVKEGGNLATLMNGNGPFQKLGLSASAMGRHDKAAGHGIGRLRAKVLLL
jgi:hypothetical protein